MMVNAQRVLMGPGPGSSKLHLDHLSVRPLGACSPNLTDFKQNGYQQPPCRRARQNLRNGVAMPTE